MRWMRDALRGISAVCAFVSIGGCCEDHHLGIRDMNARLDFGFNVAAHAKFDWNMRFDFNWDWRAWSGIRAAAGANLNLGGTGQLAFQNPVNRDMDDDGVDEQVRLLALCEVDPSTPDRVLATWQGDKFSFDEGMCYLLSVDGDRVDLLTARCDQAEPAVHCSMTAGNLASRRCGACNEAGGCMDCSSEQSVSDCVSAAKKQLGTSPADSGTPNPEASTPDTGITSDAGAGGAGGGPNVGMDSSLDVQSIAPDGAGGGAGGVTVTVEWSLCVDQVGNIASRAPSCGLAAPLDATTLCRDRLSDVNLCYLAVQATGLFGSACSALKEELACGRLFP